MSLQELGLEPDEAGLDPAPTPRSRGTRTRSLQFLRSKRGCQSFPRAILERVKEARRPRASLARTHGALGGAAFLRPPRPEARSCDPVLAVSDLWDSSSAQSSGRHSECPFVFSSILSAECSWGR